MKFKRGFTLFELLVSISIIGILMALASVSFSVAQKKARDARRMEDMDQLQKAAEQYYSINGYNYPTNYSVGTSWAVSGRTVLENFPTDPKNSGTNVYACPTGAAGGYCCCADLENDTGNSTTNSCSFLGVGNTGSYYCVKNQQ